MEKNIFLRRKLIDALSAQKEKLGIPKAFSAPIKPQKRAVELNMTAASAPSRRTEYEQMAAWHQYNDALAAYYLNIAEDKARLLIENRKLTLISRELDELARHQIESEDRLSKIYEKNIIFPKYRNLVALSSLYEYICAGRSYALEGPEGAYNIYEAERRLNRIVTQLDKIIAHLDVIRDNQFVLFSTIQEINQKYTQLLDAVQATNQQGAKLLDAVDSISIGLSRQEESINNGIDRQTARISTQLKELQKSSALAAYNADRTQRELAYMNRMDFWSGRNDDVFFNMPPL